MIIGSIVNIHVYDGLSNRRSWFNSPKATPTRTAIVMNLIIVLPLPKAYWLLLTNRRLFIPVESQGAFPTRCETLSIDNTRMLWLLSLSYIFLLFF